ncbi:MAG TPA: hypothetical protein VMT62_11695 [Syntrophorhabdaceae bacterium]|nr:hypothetical protein [Syntrophorhabdaceae bacterium]
MRRHVSIIVAVVLIVAVLFLPASSHAWGHFGHHYGWYAPGAFIGGVILGTAIARPYYYYPYPAPVYAYPPPTVVYVNPQPVYVPNQAYASPDPAATSNAAPNPATGEWIEVPGQYVNGTWVPAHKVWVSNRH